MKRTALSTLAFIMVLGPLIASHAQAGEACTQDSPKGSYGFLFYGVSGPDLLPFVAVGVETFDGKGNVSGLASTSHNGEIRHWRAFAGTYLINDDCTGSDVVRFVDGESMPTHEFVMVDGGKELRLLSTGGGANIALYRKLNLNGCAASSFKGAYGYNGIGKVISPTPADIAFAGRMVVDGEGRFGGADTIARNGEILSRTYKADYKVNPNCTGDYEADTTLGIVHSDFVIVGNGEELLVMRSDEGQVLSFTFKRQ